MLNKLKIDYLNYTKIYQNAITVAKKILPIERISTSILPPVIGKKCREVQCSNNTRKNSH